jgi:hypothetical protein
VRDFNRRMAVKMGMIFGGGLGPSTAAMQPGSAQGSAELAKETSKLKGTPVMQVVRMGITANGDPLPAASEAPLPPANQPETPSAGEIAKRSTTSAITSRFGFGGFGHKKPQEEPQNNNNNNNDDQAQQKAPQPPQPSVLLESTTQTTSFSSAPIADSEFSIPADYHEVSADKSR